MQSALKVSLHHRKTGKALRHSDAHIVAEALVRYINQGITLGSVNLPEAQLRSLTLDEPEHARVSWLSSSPWHATVLIIRYRSFTSIATYLAYCAKVCPMPPNPSECVMLTKSSQRDSRRPQRR